MGFFGNSDEDEVEGNQRTSKAKFVLPRLQVKIISNVAFAVVGLFIFSYIFFDYCRTHQFQDLYDTSSLSPEQKNSLNASIDIALGYWALICGLYSLMLISFSMVLSHKIAGPVYHMSKALYEYFEGNTKARINLRKGDEFIGLGEFVNRLIETIEKQKKALKPSDPTNSKAS